MISFPFRIKEIFDVKKQKYRIDQRRWKIRKHVKLQWCDGFYVEQIIAEIVQRKAQHNRR